MTPPSFYSCGILRQYRGVGGVSVVATMRLRSATSASSCMILATKWDTEGEITGTNTGAGVDSDMRQDHWTVTQFNFGQKK